MPGSGNLRGMSSLGAAWARERHDGIGTAEIAERESVCHQWVSRVTKPYGPFPRPQRPTPDAVARWVEERRAGRSAARIARDDGESARRVLAATREHGPFPRSLQIEGHLTISEAAQRLRLPIPTVCNWVAKGFMPQPERLGQRRVWRTEVFEEWLANAPLETCPHCGAMTRELLRHLSATHR